jgi:ABC-type branched-subunit amino acid transport system ATPase component
LTAAAAQARASAPLLDVDDVHKRFRGVQALAGVSLSVEPGEILGLIGPNGSGKTTLLNVISGFLRPTGGTVRICGSATSRLPVHRIAQLGVGRTFQQIRLFPALSVAENVEVGAVARGLGRSGVARIPRILAKTGLADHAALPAGSLAYGQQRRAEIARALAGRPRLLLLDEPAAGMNEVESDALLASLRSIREEEGCAMLIVDHDLRLIMRLCDRIHVLAEGRTIASGTPAEVQSSPAVVAAYLGEPATAAASEAAIQPQRQEDGT